MKKHVYIDPSKCVGCGLCVKDCVGCDIELKNGKAVPSEEGCIYCGHCEAICPQKAVRVEGYEEESEEFEEQTRLNPEELMAAIKTRRTIRQFTEDEVSESVIQQILEAGRLAPTGTNAQKTQFILLKDKKAACEELAVRRFRKLIGMGKAILPMLKKMKVEDNFFFKKAPVVIVILGKDAVSASLAAENMAFMAEANGLGVLFSGLFTGCYNSMGKIRKLIGMKKEPKAVTTLVIGYPAVKYHRTARRKPLQITKA